MYPYSCKEYLSFYTYSYKIPTAIPMLMGLDNSEKCVGILSDVCTVVNQRCRQLTGSRYEITYISASTANNEISTATSTFSRFRSSVKLVPVLPDVNGSRKSKMAAVKPEVHVSQLVHYRVEIPKAHVFEDGQLNGILGECCPTWAEAVNSRWPQLNRKISFKFKTLLSERVVVL